MSMDLIKIIEDMEFISHEDAIFTEIHKVLEDTLRLHMRMQYLLKFIKF